MSNWLKSIKNSIGANDLMGELLIYSSSINDDLSNQFFRKYRTMRNIEIMTIISILFYPITFIFAIIWLLFYSKKDLDICLFLKNNPQYKPQSELNSIYYDVLTNDYFISTVDRFNTVKTVLMICLAIPILGSVFFITFSIISIGTIPIFLIWRKQKPEKQIKSMTHGTNFANIRQYVRPVIQPAFPKQAATEIYSKKTFRELSDREITQLKGMLKVEKEVTIRDIARMLEREESQIRLAIYEIAGSESTNISIEGNVVRIITPKGTKISSESYKITEDESESNLCKICSTVISKGEDFAACPHCDHIFHIPHIREWLKQKDLCPVCRKQLNFDQDVIIVNAKKR